MVVHGNASGFLQEITSGEHRLRADEPVSAGGTGAAPDPYDYLLTGLGACTSMTVGLYARRKQIPLEGITVALRHSRVHAKDCADCATERRHARQNRSEGRPDWSFDARGTRQVDGSRGQMPRPSNAQVRDRDQDSRSANGVAPISRREGAVGEFARTDVRSRRREPCPRARSHKPRARSRETNSVANHEFRSRFGWRESPACD